MGFNICLFRVENDVATELPKEDWWATQHTKPTGKWDFCRYGWDHEYLSDLGGDVSDRKWVLVAPDDEGYENGTEEMWRPSDAQIATLKAKHRHNPRARLLVAMLKADPSIMVALL